MRDIIEEFLNTFVLMFLWVMILSVLGWAGYSLGAVLLPISKALWMNVVAVRVLVIWLGASLVCSACAAAIITYNDVGRRKRSEL